MTGFGGQSVILRSRSDGVVRDRFNQVTQTVTDVVWSGVLMRPVSSSESVTNADVANQVWRCTGAPTDESLAASVRDELVYEGNVYQIVAAQTFFDLSGAAEHVRITCQLQEV